jgi:CelD/BcsL family acetyltransferase involved in cellulose biosynthesis
LSLNVKTLESAGPRYRFTVLDDPAPLGRHVEAWEDLAASAVEPNVFYEPWMLLPAIEAFGRGVALRFILVYAERPGEPPLLCALLPFERLTRYKGLPLARLKLWRHKHCYLGTPLLRRGHARECLAAFLEWMAAGPCGASLVEWGLVAGDGAFHEALTAALKQTGRRSFVSHKITRAVLRPMGDAETFFAATLPGKSRKEFRRLARRLAEGGEIRYTGPQDEADLERWIGDFLALEAGGWKGRRGSALHCDEASRRFFSSIARDAARRGRLMMLGLKVADRCIALKCNFLADAGSFAFKIAYDESYARFSPGVLLELENIRRFHSRPDLQWMDSCADSEHFMANRLWPDRRTLITLITATRWTAGHLLVALLPMLRRLVRSLRFASPAPA